MPASHLCIDCGLDLVRVRAVREPRYGLPLLTCPRCDAIAVRRRHPLQVRWRAARRIAAAGVVLVIQLALFTVCFPLIGAICANLPEYLLRGDLVIRTEFEAVIAFCALVIAPVALGVWLTAGFAHWPAWWGSRAVFGALVALGLAMDTIVVPLVLSVPGFLGLDRPPVPVDLGGFAARLALLAILLGVSCAGHPIGRALLAVIGTVRRRRRSLYRRQIRRERPA